MTTVKQLREYLATLPDDMEVEVLKEKHAHWQTWTEWVPLVIHPYTGNTNLVGNTLELGEK